MSIELWREAAFETYRKIVKDNMRSDGHTPPPFTMRDKDWSYQLRLMWPDATRIVIDRDDDNAPEYREMTKWCREQPGGWWVNNGGNVWYFEKSDIAMMFKLTFGGAQ